MKPQDGLVRAAVLPFLACTFALSSCAEYTPKPISPEQSAEQFESRTLTDAGLRAFVEKSSGHPLESWPPENWDLELLTLTAFYYQPALDEARARWNLASAAVTSAGARPNPDLNVTPEYSLNPPAGVSPWLPSIGVDLQLETAGKRGYRINEAQQRAEAARLEVLSTAWQVRHEVRSALLEFAANQERVRVLDDRMQPQERIARAAGQRLAAGAAAGSDVTLARAQLARTRLELQASRLALADARVDVAQALGVPASALHDVHLVLDLERADPGDLLSADARSRALRSRADVLSALAAYAAAQSALQLEIARQYPDLFLGPGYQWDQGQNKWRLGLSVELPLISRNQGPIAEAEAHRNEAAARFTAVQAKAIGEIDHATVSLQTAQEALQSGDALLSAQRQQLQSVQGQLAAGAVSELDVATARLEVLAAQELILEARVQEQQALGALEDAVQWPAENADEARALLTRIESTQRPPEGNEQ